MWDPRVILVLASAASVFAASLDAQELFVGFRAGHGSAVQYHELGRTGSRKPNVTGGFSATLDFKPWLAIESDLMYAEKGWQEASEDLRMTYAELPVLLRLSSPVPVVGLQLFVHGGPAPSLELFCSAAHPFPRSRNHGTTDGTTSSPARVGRHACFDHRETRRDFGWVTGGGLLIRRPAFQITVSMRRTTGVRDLLPEDAHHQRFNDTRAFLVSFTARAK